MQSCKEDDPKPESNTFEIATAFTIDNSGAKFIGTDKGLYKLDEQNQKLIKVELSRNLPSINDLNSSGANLWIASNEGVLNNVTGEFLTTENSQIANNKIKALSRDANNSMYFAWQNGISILFNNQWFQNTGLNDFFQNHTITDIATTTDGYTYAATSSGGIERFRCGVDGISGATTLDTDWTRLNSNNILTVFTIDTIQAYGTDQGAAIHYSEFTKWDWETFTRFDGLVSDTVISIVRDTDETWWFGTYRGLSHYNGTSWTLYNVANSSIPSDTIRFLDIDRNGTIWMATDAGLSYFSNNQWTNILK